jgi:hypothetical protein
LLWKRYENLAKLKEDSYLLGVNFVIITKTDKMMGSGVLSIGVGRRDVDDR